MESGRAVRVSSGSGGGRVKIRGLVAMDGADGDPLQGAAVTPAAPAGTKFVFVDSSGAAAPASSASSPPQVLASPVSGQFYVIGSPADVLGATGQGTVSTMAPRIVPKTAASGLEVLAPASSSSSSSTTAPALPAKDERRRATHNEVERRRRDNINTWIVRLSKLIPPEAGKNRFVRVQFILTN